MGYMKIQNLYKEQHVLLFKEVYVLEKVHGTSAHVRYKDDALHFFSGGEKHEIFLKCFDHDDLLARFRAWGVDDVTVFGEAYGGRMQGMKATYGDKAQFIAFEVKIGEHNYMDVPTADFYATRLGLEFVPWARVPADLETLNHHRDLPSEVGARRGCPGQKREGIVIRPLLELRKAGGDRIMAKHKSEAFSEHSRPRDAADPDAAKLVEDAQAAARDWATPMRLEHVLDKLGPVGIEDTKRVIQAMVDDIYTEGKGEVVESRALAKAIGNITAKLFKTRLQQVLTEAKP